MAFQLSPGVLIKEQDLTNVVPAVATTIGGICGDFEWGPAHEIVSVDSENNLVDRFGKPRLSEYEDFMTAGSFLAYGSNLLTVREVGSSALNSTSDGTGLLIKNKGIYDESYSGGEASKGCWAARYAGAKGNSLKVSMADFTSWNATSVASATITNAGTGYSTAPTVSFAAAPAGGQTATATATVGGGAITAITITFGGYGYVSAPAITFSGGGGSSGAATAVLGTNWAYQSEFDNAPGNTQWSADKSAQLDELHVIVVDEDGAFTGVAGTVLEKFAGVSKASDAKSSVGETNFYVDVIQQKSEYVYWGEHETGLFDVDSGTGTFGLVGTTSFDLLVSSAGSTNYPQGATTVGSKGNSTYYYRLESGADYTISGGNYAVTQPDVTTAYSLLEDPESQTIDFILTGPSGADDAAALAKVTALAAIVDERRDCILFVSPKRSDLVGVSSAATQTDNLISFFNQLPSSSYIVFDSGYKYIYDKYNDVYRYVPCNGDIAGLCLQTTEVAEPWFSPAGFQRGVLRNAIKLAYTPTKTQRDRLYANRINPVVSFPGQGVVLFGDKTALGFASAFDRINVRRLFLTIERVISGAAKAQLFEQNDEAQRSLFLNIIEPYLRDVQGRRGVTDFLVKCDASNNPPEAVDRGEFYAEIFVKPTRTINYITLTFVATRTGVAFSEVAN